ncbi:MAG: FG-GAP-like repeat-containing protein [Phycisphaerales bacterium]
MARTSSGTRSIILLAVSAGSDCAMAQFVEPEVRVIHTFAGAAGTQLGWAVSGMRDIDGDGVMELIIPSPGATANRGRVDVFSGASGALIPHLSLLGSVNNGRFGHAIADAGDVNNDGKVDLIVGSPAPAGTEGRVLVFSGLDGSLIRSRNGDVIGNQFGYAVAGVGDLNNDNRGDYIVGAPGPTGVPVERGRVYVFSGLDGSVIRFHDGEAAGDVLGMGVSGVGDLNGDGVPEYAAAAPRGGPGRRGRAYVWSGSTGQLLLPVMDAQATGGSFGDFFVGSAGDVDHDGKPDLYIGDYTDSRAYVFSGRDGHRVHSLQQNSTEGLGCGRGAGDVNGDRRDDLVVGAYASSAGASQAGRVYVYSGHDGSILRTITSARSGEQFGFDAVGVGDVDGDGRLDFLVGAASGNRTYVIAGVHQVCYANCDSGTIAPTLNVADFVCFLNRFAAGDLYANCDDSTSTPLLNVNDFICYLNAFSLGCS